MENDNSKNLPGMRCGRLDEHSAHEILRPGDRFYWCSGKGDFEDWIGQDPEVTWLGWRTLPDDPPPGEAPGSGHWLRDVDDFGIWISYAPQSPRTQIDHAGSDTAPPPLTGGSRARRMGFRLGRILGTLTRGSVSPKRKDWEW